MSINPIKITNSPAARKHVAFLSYDGLSDPLGQSQILPYLLGLAELDYDIEIFSCEKPERLAAEKNMLAQQLLQAGIRWHYLLYDEQGGWLSRWHYTRRLFNMVRKQHLLKQFELLHCRSYLAALNGKKMFRRYGIPFLFDMRGFWADERMDGGIWNKKNRWQVLLYRYFKFQEKRLLKKAAGVICLTNAGLQELIRLYPELSLQKKTSIIPCCTNTALFDPEKVRGHLISDLPEDTHLFVYTGSIGTWYQTREMIECLLVWRRKIPDLRLLILTRDQQALQRVLSSFQADLSFIRSASARHAEVPAYLAKARAAIFFIKPAYSKIASSPTKMAECWAMDLPIISNRGIGDGDELFKTFQGGILVQGFSETAYETACDAYLATPFKKGGLRRIALETFDHRSAVKRYQQAYQNILSTSV
jgi:glycosyltransferase involved in cell wall biosynthesis